MAMRRSSRSFTRVGAAAVAMVLVAEAGVWLLRERPAPIGPVPVSESDYFTAAQIDRGRDYSQGQLWLYAGGLAIELAVLVPPALGRPRRAREMLSRLGARPVAGGAAAGAAISLSVAVAGLPVAIASHERAVDFGLSTQDLGSWLGDAAKSTGIGALLAAGGGALVILGIRRFGRRWWLPGSVAVVLFAAVSTWLAPVVIAPLFNRFEPLPEGSPARTEVLALGRRAGVDIGQVYRVDASRRVTALNAYVDGIGSTKRVVLYDNLINGADRAELGSVVAHELGHVKHDDILRGLAFVALIAPFGVLFVRELVEPFARRAGADPSSPAALPAYALTLFVASFVLGVAGNQLSRNVEAGADQFALELTHDPKAFIELQRRLTVSNLGDPSPPGLVHWLLGTHPAAVERIGAAVAFRRAGD
jgi:STE24 endopeptidase